MAVPAVPTSVAGDKIEAIAWGQQLAAAMNFILDPPRCGVYDNTGIVIANGAEVVLSFDAESYDSASMHSNTTNPSRITAPETGRYLLHIHVALPSATYTALAINLRINANGNPAGGTGVRIWQKHAGPPHVTISAEIRLDAGDYIQIWVQQTSGASRTTVSGSLLATGVQLQWMAIS